MLLPDRDTAGAALVVYDGGGHHHVQVAGLGDHGVGVDLAHVVPLVLGLHVPDGEGPGVVAVVDDVEPGDAGDHVAPDGQDHLTVNMNPGNLNKDGQHGRIVMGDHPHLVVQEVGDHTLEGGLPAQGHGGVADSLGDLWTSTAVYCKIIDDNMQGVKHA